MEAAEKTIESPPAGGIAKLAMALAAAQGEFLPIVKNKVARIKPRDKAAYEFFYADLADILIAIRPALAKHEIAVVQPIINGTLHTTLIHASGETLTSSWPLPNVTDFKQLGATLTYLRRYQLSALVCVAGDDDLDDGGGPGDHGNLPPPADHGNLPPPAERGTSRRASAAGNAPEGKAPASELEPYPQEKFTENFPTWRDAIKAGRKSADEVIATLSTRAILSELQKEAISKCEPHDGDTA